MSTGDRTAPRRWAGLAAGGASAALLAWSLIACTSEATEGETTVIEDDGDAGTLPSAEKHGTGAERTDLEPLTSRFAAIGDPTSAIWMSGTTGDDRAPGPSTYWIDAIITLDPTTADTLRSDFGAVGTDDVPDVVDGLVDQLPAGPWLTSAALDRETDGGGLGGRAYIAANSDQVVIVKVGGPN